MRTASLVTMTRLRGARSASTPAPKPKIAHGTTPAKPTTPARAGECVSASTSNG